MTKWLVVPFTALLIGLASSPPVAAQGRTGTGQSTAGTRTPLDTADGHPDLQGVWNFATLTPLERPPELAGKEFLTAEEAAEFERRVSERENRDREVGRARSGPTGSYNEFWYDRGTTLIGARRTSLIVDPADGRVPPLTPQVRKRATLEAGWIEGTSRADSYEDRSLPERCLVGLNAGPPITPGPYGNVVQLFQTREHFVILNEMIHDARIVPLDGRPHLPPHLRQWMGDSRARWEGRTLIIETRNFTEKTSFRGASEHMHLTERFTRVDADTLSYDFTVNDPTSFTKPWTARIPMKKSVGHLYEYACHEGNYAMTNILSGARASEDVKRTTTKEGR